MLVRYIRLPEERSCMGSDRAVLYIQFSVLLTTLRNRGMVYEPPCA